LKKANIKVLKNFPKSSQDLNVIEVAWRELKARLYATAPTKLENRDNFLRRMHRAVAWVNKNRADLFLELCQGQKVRARQILAKGARIKEKKIAA
jgi:ribosomal protein S3